MMRRTRKTIVAAASAAALVLSGCTTMPGDTTPQAIRPFEAPAHDIEVPTPRPDAAPDLVLRDFYAASAHPTDDYAAAKKFLTDDAREKWNPHAGRWIVDGINVIGDGGGDEDARSFGTRGSIVGALAENGAYETQSALYEDSVELRMNEEGQWRIARLPDGVLLERQAFLDSHAPRNVYFLDPSGNQLVPDNRWIYRGVGDAAMELLKTMRGGPRNRLMPGVTSSFPAEAAVEVGRQEEGPGRVIRLTGLGDLDETLRRLLAAQIVWTLASADVRGPWVLEADGRPLVESHPGPWTRDSDELRTLDPTKGPGDRAPLHAVETGGVVEVTDNGQRKLPGWTSEGGRVLVSAGIGVDEAGTRLIAGVSRADRGGSGESSLLLGRAGVAPERVLSAKSLTRPSWSPDAASVWTVVDGDRVLRLVGNSSAVPAVEEIDVSGIPEVGGGISELRVDPSGTQVAMIAGGNIWIATIEQAESGPWRLVNARRLSLTDGVTPVTLAWAPNSTIIVGAYGDSAPMWRIYPDGSVNYMLPKLNLSPPVAVVSATSSKIFALDDNALMELVTGEGEAQFWRAVPGVEGRAAPVTVE
ncbi:LpqB family beta-propeller domain-containing protein [Corynebacterium hansenii]|uniref:Lipoprotein LpqB n=1 Tax=Corynebacterium hansenii TaxID=394964 RepID=A0ABV7ZLH3_9CORY|nr:LpqB family beta-propeller domain-containing protein [Corynebacterium hansenii]WJY99175.1 Lipoprotein LpqB precursor [Corynebacterium hansenii]